MKKGASGVSANLCGAPLRPECTVCILDLDGIRPSVTERRGEGLIAELVAGVFTEDSLVDDFKGFGDVVGFGCCDEFAASYSGQERRADPSGMGLSEQCERGDTHDERLAGGGGAGVRESVQGQVELVVGIKVVFGGGGKGAEIETGLVDAFICEAFEEFGFEFFVGELW